MVVGGISDDEVCVVDVVVVVGVVGFDVESVKVFFGLVFIFDYIGSVFNVV